MAATTTSTISLLLAGLRTLFFQRIDLAQLRTLGPEVIAIAVLSISSDGLCEYVTANAPATFVAWGVSTTVANIAFLSAGLLLIGTHRRGIEIATVVSVLLAMNVWLNGVAVIAHTLPDIIVSRLSKGSYQSLAEVLNANVETALTLIVFVWALSAIACLGWRATPLAPGRFAAGLVAASLGGALLLPQMPLMSASDGSDEATHGLISHAYEALKSRPVRSANAAPRPPQIDVEATFARQPELLDKALDTLKPSRTDRPEVYFVGMAPYSSQDVFKREITSAHQIVDERLDTAGRSVVMTNHADTIETHPLATMTNLERVLWRIAQRMDREKDILVLYITTHGIEGLMSVSFSRFALNDITPDKLAAILARTGIKNRVIMLSACHSGSFLPALAHPDAVVMAAARADRSSFGCSNGRDWTFFGDALFNHALRETRSLPDAFERAKVTVTKWETEQKLSPASEPQITIGENIAPKLAALAHGLEHGFSSTKLIKPAPMPDAAARVRR
jgi:Peptidase C13 family